MKKLIIVIIFFILLASIFYPGLEKEKILSVLNSTDWVAKQHIDSKIFEQDLMSVIPAPLGSLVSTYEGAWYITFWGKVF
ncbi:MAG: hypothetical protein AAB781_01580 [Patescibacteria group bacterium]